MFGYLVWHKDQCKDLTDEPNLGNVVFQTTDITGKDRDAGFESIQIDRAWVEESPLDMAVARFGAMMLVKLYKKQKEGFGGGLDKLKTTNQFLSERLRECVDKQDPIDVANFAMFIHQRGETISLIGRNPAGYLHTISNVFIDVEGWQLLLPDTRKLYKPVFW